ncbi:heat shock protein beta-7 isoform X1 [Kryptolebias marmoratus]|uniref:Heat shock protein family B (small) member 7 n=1 Tax=Kryptolebias marmoratus TaxID=37003 RepID=A0A3Q2ZW29_KRYMA|nr:heat shock protein beta-7 isoform X1 [Kryptolebias marmoratus]
MADSQSIYSEDSGCLPLHETKDHKFTGPSCSSGKLQITGDSFQFALDVREFSPEDVIVISTNNLLEVRAEKLGEDGAITNTFSHQCKLPSDVDPSSVSLSLESSGVLTVRARKM